MRVTTGRSASHLPHTRPVSPEASLLRATRAYGPVWPNKRLAGYFGRQQHDKWGPMVQPVDGHDGGVKMGERWPNQPDLIPSDRRPASPPPPTPIRNDRAAAPERSGPEAARSNQPSAGTDSIR
jgi:hypothetical protein